MSVKNLFEAVDRAMAKHITCPLYVLEARKAIAAQEDIRTIAAAQNVIARENMNRHERDMYAAEREIRRLRTLIDEYEKDAGVRS